VIGGFLAGTGWLLLVGGLQVSTGIPLSMEIFLIDYVPRWLFALAFAVIALVMTRRINHFLVLPMLLVLAIAIFHALLFFSGTTLQQAEANGFLLGRVISSAEWRPFRPQDLSLIHWPLILRSAGMFAAVVVLSTVTLLLNATGIELAVRRNIDLNQVLKTAGWANILSGFTGGFVGFPTLSLTVLAQRMGAESRLTELVKAGFGLMMMVAGGSLLVYLPRPVLGGLLLYLALTFLVEWLYEAWGKLPRAEYAIAILILVASAVMGYAEGVLVGIVAALILFVFNYSTIEVIKREMTCCNRQSKVVRSHSQRQYLIEQGDQVQIIELQGFIFFGTANSLLEHVEQRIFATDRLRPRYILFDFRRVLRLDSSAVMSFTRLFQLAETENITLVFTQLSGSILKHLEASGLPLADSNLLMTFQDIDRGVEWCEDVLLDEADLIEPVISFEDQFQQMFSDPAFMDRVLAYLIHETIPADYVLARQGDMSDELFFIQSGKLTVQIEVGQGQSARIRTAGAGTVLGEVGFYLGTPRTASIVTDEESVIYRMSSAVMERMRQEDPDTAAMFHEFIARLLAERLIDTTAMLQVAMS
jgi:sulfate permease, SulP family